MDESTAPIVVWKPSFAIEIPTIDTEHRRLLGMMNELYDALVHGESARHLRTLHAHLAAYASFHFSGEEEFLEAVQFPARAAHQKQHAWFIGKVRSLELGTSEASRATLAVVKDWFVEHILGTDKAFATWIETNVAVATMAERRFHPPRAPSGTSRPKAGAPRQAGPVLLGVETRPRPPRA